MAASKPALRLIGALVLGCALMPVNTAAEPVAAAAVDPVAFFTGSTQGVGQIKKMFSAAHRTVTYGHGVVRADGVLVLDHRVEEQGEAVRVRRWLLHETGPGHFSGSLSDASGPVSATVTGNRLGIRYTMRGGMRVDQVLTFAPGGQSASNVMKISKFGMTVATLTETIRRN
ncbi:MAG: DUF3833 family protein [Novosphingobium sp.]